MLIEGSCIPEPFVVVKAGVLVADGTIAAGAPAGGGGAVSLLGRGDTVAGANGGGPGGCEPAEGTTTPFWEPV